MQIKNILLLSFLGLTGAFKIPEGQEDGVYEHHVGTDGIGIFTKIANATDYSNVELSTYAEATTPNRFARRSLSCGGAHDLHHGDTDAANADLDHQCDTYGPVKPRHNYYAIRGSVVAFYCNFEFFNRQSCNSGDRQRKSGEITNACGWYNSGWWTNGGGSESYGYDGSRCFCGECV